MDFSFEFRERAKDTKNGLFILHIDDDGEGMNRKIIDTELTRLFSSSKEDDWSKIGKFGIGFVSVFALKPNAVIVDTGRGGEFWRVFFKADRSFDRIVLDREVKGTKIEFINEIETALVEPWKRRSKETLQFWCRYCSTDIRLEGEQINSEFAFDTPYSVFVQEPGPRITLAPACDEKPFCAFYCKGLTLYENNEARVPGITFRLDYENLSHTLTRDNVIQDEHYSDGMSRLR